MESQDETLKENLLRLRTTVLEYDTIISILSNAISELHLRDPKVSGQQSEGNKDGKSLGYHTTVKYISQYQIAILQFIVPHWLEQLEENGQLSLVKTFFLSNSASLSPSQSYQSYQCKIECVISAHVNLLTPPLSQLSVDMLEELRSANTNIISLVDIFKYLFNAKTGTGADNTRRWDDYLSSVFSIYGRVGNAGSDGIIKVPESLYADNFILSICQDFVGLLHCKEYNPRSESHTEATSSLMGRLITVGAFPLTPPLLPTIPSFWANKLPHLRSDLLNQINNNQDLRDQPVSVIQRGFIASLFLLPLSQQLVVVTSLFSHLRVILHKDDHQIDVAISDDRDARGVIKREAQLVFYILGDLFAYPIMYRPSSSQEVRQAEGDSDDEDLDDVDGSRNGSQPTLWSLVSVILGRSLSIELMRVLVCWAAMSRHRERALNTLLDRVLELWSNADHIKHSTLARHQALTALLLTTVANLSLPQSSGSLSSGTASNSTSLSNEPNVVMKTLSRRAQLITAVGAYISHLDMNIRRCGMLVAEVVARGAGGKLEFPGWEGQEEGQRWARQIRVLITNRDSDAIATIDSDVLKSDHGTEKTAAEDQISASRETPIAATTSHALQDDDQDLPKLRIIENGEDSDDSLEGYESASTSSSRAASPIPSASGGVTTAHDKKDLHQLDPTIDEINADPSLLNPQKKRARKPVYLLELGRLLKEGKEGAEQCDNIGMALSTGAALIRRKVGWGTELEENAVDLTINFMGLQNNYKFESFEQKVLEALAALVACCPRKAAPCIIEHFFTPNYSTSHRFNMLNALALGARELAGLPTPQISTESQSSFPSRLLPPSLHAKYASKNDITPNSGGTQVKALAEGISSLAIEKAQKSAEEKVPEIARERQLTVGGMRKTLKPGAIVELDGSHSGQSSSLSSMTKSSPQAHSRTSFNEVAAEYFIGPLLSQFWAYLRDMLSREEYASKFSPRNRGGYTAAGTGMILSPLVLSHFINTVAVLVHSSRHSPAFLSIISPGVLELAVTLGTRKMSTNEDTPSNSDTAGIMEQESKKAAAVLRSSLELAIVALDGVIDVDGGKVLALEHGTLFASVAAWAEKAFNLVDKGISLEGIGGGEEGKLLRASSGLVLKVEEIKNKWRQSMLLPY